MAALLHCHFLTLTPLKTLIIMTTDNLLMPSFSAPGTLVADSDLETLLNLLGDDDDKDEDDEDEDEDDDDDDFDDDFDDEDFDEEEMDDEDLDDDDDNIEGEEDGDDEA